MLSAWRSARLPADRAVADDADVLPLVFALAAFEPVCPVFDRRSCDAA
jgi:hypothetical protein